MTVSKDIANLKKKKFNTCMCVWGGGGFKFLSFLEFKDITTPDKEQ